MRTHAHRRCDGFAAEALQVLPHAHYRPLVSLLERPLKRSAAELQGRPEAPPRSAVLEGVFVALADELALI